MFKILMFVVMVIAGSANATEQPPFQGVQVQRPADEAHHVDFYKTYQAMAYYRGKPYKAIYITVNNNGMASYTTTDATGTDKFTVKVDSAFPVKVTIAVAHGDEKEEGSFLVGMQPGEWSEAKMGHFTIKMERGEDTVELSP